MQTRHWIGGEWVTTSGESFVVKNPSNISEEVGVVQCATEKEVLQAGVAAKQAAPAWGRLTPTKRASYLATLADLFKAHVADLAELASREMGKPIAEMRGEVMRAVQILQYYAGEGPRSNGSVIPANADNVLQYTKRVPLGVVGVITPWNFPVAIPIWKIAPALICGNTVIWKPAENASLTAAKMAELFEEAKLPQGVLNLVLGHGKTIGDVLVSELELDAITFTGSTATGRSIAAKCAQRNIKFQTEMGGKNAAIVLNDADLSVTVPALMSGAFRSAGQKCTATSRLIVENGIRDALIDGLQGAMSEIRFGHALDEATYVGPVASEAQYEKVKSYVSLAEQEATILATATPVVDTLQGYYITPTIVEGVDAAHRLIQEEVFGPFMAVLTVDNFDQAVSVCNDTVYGLSASLFTQNLSNALRFMDEVDAGLVRVNQETAGVEYQSPFGGMKMSSSHTREQGQAALEFYSQVKTCAIAY